MNRSSGGGRFLRHGGTLYQRGSGLGSILSKFALPAIRKLAPAVKSVVRKHGKSAVRSVARAGLKSLSRKRKRKNGLVNEMSRVVARKLVHRGGGGPKTKKKKKSGGRVGGGGKKKRFRRRRRRDIFHTAV